MGYPLENDSKLKQLFEEEHEISIEQKETVKIPVCYDKEFALDIDRVSKNTKLSTDEIIPTYQREIPCLLLGFSLDSHTSVVWIKNWRPQG